MSEAFKGALERLVAAAQAAHQAGDPAAARSALAAIARELAAAIDALPAPVAAVAKIDTKVEVKGDPKVEPKVEPKNESKSAPRPEDEVFRDLADLHKALKAGTSPLDPADIDWMEKTPQILKNFAEADKSGPKMTSFLATIVGKLDGLLAFLRWTRESAGRDAAKSVRQKAITQITLRGGMANETPGDAVKIRSKAPAGSVVAILKTGFGEPARALVSAGDGTDASEQMEAAIRGVGAETSTSPEGRALRAAIVKKCEQYLTELPGKDGEFETTVVRYVLNELHRLDDEEHCKPLMKFLSGRGYNEILVQIGSVFDESYSPNKYERRKVSVPGSPRNSIVKMLQHGFTNKQGVCVQKCVVAVASE